MKKTILLLSTILISGITTAETKTTLTFPYSEYKEIEFVNPTLTNNFEKYITNMQKSDIKFSKEYTKVESEYQKRYLKAQKRGAYKKDHERQLMVNKIVISEEKDYNLLMSGYLKEQIDVFNVFVKETQKSKHITKAENILFLKSIKSVHQSYIDAHNSLKYRIGSYNDYCFDKKSESSIPDWCHLVYEESINDIKEFKYMINTKMNNFITSYKVNSTKRSFRNELKIRIEEINRYKEFKWE